MLWPVIALTTFSMAYAVNEPRPIIGQSEKFVVNTTLTQEEEENFNIMYANSFAKLDSKTMLTWRANLQTPAKANDPLAQYFYAQTYDLYPFGTGTTQDAKIALAWYTKAADAKLASAEYYLAQAYTYSFMRIPINLKLAGNYLRRAYDHSGGRQRGLVALELARQVDPDRSELRAEGFLASDKQLQSYLEESIKFNPLETTALDWLFSIYLDQKLSSKAIDMAERSENPLTWQRMADIYKNGGYGIKPTPAKALEFYQTSAIAFKDQVEQGDPFAEDHLRTDLYSLYEMECLGQIKRSDFKDAEYKNIFQDYQKAPKDDKKCKVLAGE